MEKQSTKRGSDGGVSVFPIENLPSFDRFAKFRFPHTTVSLPGNQSSKKWSNKYGLFLFLLVRFFLGDRSLNIREGPKAIAG